jgi:glutamine synthetase
VHAGLSGVRERLECPPILDRDPANLSSAELAHYGAATMPTSLTDALACLHNDDTARGWLPALLYDTYVAVKRAELSLVEQLDQDEICRRYAAAY